MSDKESYGETKRERSYGGRVGVWLKRKKHRTSFGSTNEDDFVTVSGIVSSNEGETKGPGSLCENVMCIKSEEHKYGVVRSESSTSSSPRLIGWDEIRCRPIFEKGKSGVSSSEKNVRTYVEEEDEMEEGDGCQDDDELSIDKTSYWRRMNQGKTYGTRRISNVTITDNNCDLAIPQSQTTRVHSPQNDNTLKRGFFHCVISDPTRSGVVTPPDDMDGLPVPPFHTLSCYDEASSSVTATGIGSKQTKRESGAKQKTASIKKPKRSRDTIPKDPKEAPEENDGSLVKQPSVTNTSLSSAKAFFHHLDSTQKLHTANYSLDNEPSRPCIRTTHLIDIRCPEIQSEYKIYCKATTECGVIPIPIEEYTDQRGVNFIARGGINGVLDRAWR